MECGEICDSCVSLVAEQDGLLELTLSEPQVQGNVKKHSEFWVTQLNPSSFIRDIVLYGYRLPFLSYPDPVVRRNHVSAQVENKFVESEIVNLLEANCIVECKVCPTVCSPLSVVCNSKGKKRLVLDLRGVNEFLPKQKFKYEGLNLIPDMCGQGEYFFTFDLKSGYHHVDIHPDCWTYLGFSWVWPAGLRRFYMFRVLPFGLSTACYVFSKFLRPLVKRWRSSGLRVILYIDDAICIADSAANCMVARQVLLADLERAGLVLNMEKSHLEPQQVGEWLGFVVNLDKGLFVVPVEKIKKLQSTIQCIPSGKSVSVRLLASVVGQIISMSLAIGPIARLRSRYLYDSINRRWSWHDKIFLSKEATDELEFWGSSINKFNGQPIWFSPGATRIAYSDASVSGYGGYVVELGREVSHGMWSEAEAKLSSAWRELKAIDRVLRSFAPKLQGHKVKWFTDNQSVQFIVMHGSRHLHLQDGAMSIFEICMSFALKLEVEWLPRSRNERADYISRIVDFDDWKIDPAIYVYLDSLWGPHTVDCFASFYNSQTPRFFSRFWNPGSEAADAFTVSWYGEVCWMVPPLHLVCRVLKHARVCSAVGTLIVPAWKSAPYWPLLCPDGVHLAEYIHCWEPIQFYPQLFIEGHSGNSIGSALTTGSVILALFIDFTQPPRQYNAGFCTYDYSGSCSDCNLVWSPAQMIGRHN